MGREGSALRRKARASTLVQHALLDEQLSCSVLLDCISGAKAMQQPTRTWLTARSLWQTTFPLPFPFCADDATRVQSSFNRLSCYRRERRLFFIVIWKDEDSHSHFALPRSSRPFLLTM